MTELAYRHWNESLDPDVCVSVDGDAPGRLHLSHWPDNRTPHRFRHDLSTGSCLKLAEAEDRLTTLRGFTTVTNNHWDTDGACSVFTMVEPALALAHAQELLCAAIAGDFSVFSTPEGVKIDLTLTALTKHADSPVASHKFDDELERRQAQYDHALEMLPRLLANPDLHADWFATEFWTIQQDLRAMREDEAEVENFDALDFAVVVTDRPLHETSVNTFTGVDRILTVQLGDSGMHRYELRLTTLSWFEMVTAPARKRLDWSPLARQLNNEAAGGDGKWVAEDPSHPTPKLAYVDEEGRTVPNAIRPEVIKRKIAQFLAQDPFLPAGV